MSGIALVYTLFPDRDSAGAAVRQCIHEGFAACANILAPCTSVYEWKGEIQENAEIPVLLKTTAARVDDLIERLSVLHPYEVPAILSWPVVRAHHDFAKWVNDWTHK